MILWDNGTCLRFQTDWHSIMQRQRRREREVTDKLSESQETSITQIVNILGFLQG